ncbi:MAG: SDR family oxidoreductase [Planctomycetota bacterium]
MRDLAGKRALVTGAASGIGRATALRLAGERADLFLVDVDQVGMEATAAEARRTGVEVATRHADLSRAAGVSAIAREAIDRWAGVDVLVNNAGITYYGYTHEMTDAQWDRLMAINLDAPVRLTRALLPSLLARPEAHVLNVCSVLGLVGLPRVGAYCTSKFGLVGFSQTLRSEYNRSGLGVTALCPGFARTNLFAAAEPRPGASTKAPPAVLCTTPARVARAAVSAIKRNRAVVRVEPFSKALFAFHQSFPTAMDWLLGIGQRRRVKRKAARLAQLSDDRTESIRLQLVEDAARLESLRKAA